MADRVSPETIYRLRAMAADEETNTNGDQCFVAKELHIPLITTFWELACSQEAVGAVLIVGMFWLLYFASTHTFPW